MKQCKKCGVEKPLADFYAHKGMRDGRRSECKACSIEARKKWYREHREQSIEYVRSWQRANPDRVKAWRVENRDRINKQLREIHLRNRFDLTPAQYDAMLERQGGGCCAICGDRPPATSSLHVDHDHGTGEIRALLCVRCNNGIGLFREQPRLLRRAATYVTAEPRLRSARAELDALARARARALVKAGI